MVIDNDGHAVLSSVYVEAVISGETMNVAFSFLYFRHNLFVKCPELLHICLPLDVGTTVDAFLDKTHFW